MSQQRHIIGRTVLELNTSNLADVWSLQEEVSRLFQQQAVPEMERLFDRLVGTDEVVRLDRIVVEVGVVDRQCLADEFLRNLLSILDQTLSDSLQESVLQNRLDNLRSDSVTPATIRDRAGADWEVLLYFLQYGRLPWWVTAGDWQNWFPRWEAVMQRGTNWRMSLLTLLATNSAARQRLVEQFPEPFRHQLILHLHPAWTNWDTLLGQARQLMQDLGLSRTTARQLERQAWLLLLAEVTPDSSLMQPLPAAIWMRNWLMQLVQIGQGDIAPGILEAGETLQAIAYQRLRVSLEIIPPFERTLWLAASDQAIASSSVDTSAPHSDLTIWLDFLQQGCLTVEQSSVAWQEWLSRWEALMQGDTNWREPLRVLLATNSAVRQRLVEQFSESFRHQLILQMQPFWLSWYGLLNEARQVMQMLNLGSDTVRDLETQAWLLILAELGIGSESLPTATWIQNWLAQLVQAEAESAASAQGWEATETPQSDSLGQRLRTILEAAPLEEPELWLVALDRVLMSPSTDTSVPSLGREERTSRPTRQTRTFQPSDRSTLSPEEETAGLYLTQAGLVLLHPFLRFYLEAVGLVEGETFRDELAQQTAIYLVYYLATKQIDAPEYELVLPKLLCGWALDEPVVRGVELPESALEEGEHLLQTAIDYWEALKSTSPDGLREGFLQRSGKLTRTDSGWKLQVEQQSIDILLSRLPWGVSMVKLPWMEDLLTVEWT